MVLIGETGVGKSQLTNFIVKEKDKVVVGNGKDSETIIPAGVSVERNGKIVWVIDTPGFNDTEDRDKKILDEIVDFIKKKKNITALCFVYNYTVQRKTSKDRELINNIVEVFGKEAVKRRLFFIFTNSPEPEDIDREEEIKMNSQKSGIIKLFGEKLEGDFNPNFYFVNTKYNPKFNRLFQPTIDDLINEINNVKTTYGTMHVDAVDTKKAVIITQKDFENNEVKLKIANLETEIERLEREIDSDKIDLQDMINHKKGKGKRIAGWITLLIFPASIPLLITGYKDKNKHKDEIDKKAEKIQEKERRLAELKNEKNLLFNTINN